MKAQFIVALVTPGISASLGASKTVGDNAQYLALGVLHHRVTNRHPEGPEHTPQSLRVSSIDSSDQGKSPAEGELFLCLVDEGLNLSGGVFDCVRVQPQLATAGQLIR